MNEQFETQNPVENTVTPANQMETPIPEAPKKKGNKIAIIAGVVAAVVVAGGVGVFAAVKTGAFLSPSKKVLLAGVKTMSDMGSFGEALKDCVSLYSDEYTLKMDVSMNEGDISMEGRSSKEQKQIKGNLNISGAPSIDFLADIGADSVQVEVPTISERLFTYDYRNEKSGYLLEMVDQDTLDAVDATLKAAYDNQNSDEFRKKMLKVYADEYNTLEFSKVDAKDFTIDGTERSCKGYQTVVTKDNVNHVIDGLETLYGEDYQELMDALDLTAADFVASMREAVEEFADSTTLVFYLYKGQYAAIDIIPENDVSFEVQFLGGDTRMQNMILLADDEKVIEVQGSNEGSVETIMMTAEENDTVKFTYDSDSGDIAMEAKYDEESYNFAGNLAESRLTWWDFSEEFAIKTVKESVEAYAATYGETVLYSSARNEYAITRMSRILTRTVLTLQQHLKQGSFQPDDYELSFRFAEDLDSIHVDLSEEEKMHLQGRIDRIDVSEDAEHVYVKVIDYKSGNKKFDLAALYYGLQLQLVVYMNAAMELESRKHPDKEIVPAALLY